ncbi:hypothetical protein [Gymnodinialimonas sp.]
MMKTVITALTLSLLATPVVAIDLEFTGDISMGLVGTSSGGESGVSPFVGVDAEATISFELGDALTVGIVLPLDGEIVDDGVLPGHR